MTKDENNENVKKNEDGWLYDDLYPERRQSHRKRNWWRTFVGLEGKEELHKIKCERNVYWCFRNSPLVKLLVGALNSAGCEFDIRRHISCEICDSKVSGGYDQEFNQVIICQNVIRRKSHIQATLTHELIHMFDYCRNEFDFRNLDHLACSEIRAANLAHCSFLSAMSSGTASPFKLKATHKECVKEKALTSILAVKNISKAEALEVLERVFPKCYTDLEPIGRRCRRNSNNFELAFLEAPLYGYDYKI